VPATTPDARARVNARHAEQARKRARALVEDSLWLLEVGGCSFAEIIARTGYRNVGSYAAALRRAGRLDVLYRVRRDYPALQRWQREKERERRRRKAEWMRAYRARTRAAAWEQVKAEHREELGRELVAERFGGVAAEAAGVEEEACAWGPPRVLRWTPEAVETANQLMFVLAELVNGADRREAWLEREEAS
jgi:hypothetical protein